MAEPVEKLLPEAGLALSVIICTYNREKFLPDALNSLARQTADAARYEIVIVNNNSTDRTDVICRQFLQEHPELNINYQVEPRQGLSHARNRGMAEAKGRLLTYIDDDAIATPEFVERILSFFQEHRDAIAAGGKVLAVFEGDRPHWFNPYSASLFFSHYDRGGQVFRYRGRSGYPIGCNMTFRAGFLRQAQGFDTGLGRRGKDGIGAEEKELFKRLIDKNLPFYYDPEQIVYHQIDQFRTERPYTRKLALGLGQTHRKMYCKNGAGVACALQFLLTVLKLFAAAALALLYLFRGRPAVSGHLVWYRWLVLKGMMLG